MTEIEWTCSTSAPDMLARLHQTQPEFFASQVRNLHRFLIACCWKHQDLIPQEGLRNGLAGAEKWLDGTIGNQELDRLDWQAEAVAFGLDYAETPDELSEIKVLVDSIEQLRGLSFDEARSLLLDAAYFAQGSIIYPRVRPLPWHEALFTSRFLCPDLLRRHVRPDFG